MFTAGRNASANPPQPPRQRVIPSAHKTHTRSEHDEPGDQAHDDCPSVRFVLEQLAPGDWPHCEISR